MASGFDPWQVAFGALLGALAGAIPSTLLFYLEGRRARADRIRLARMQAIDAAIGRVAKLVDHAASVLSNAPGVLGHDAVAFYGADLSLIPDQASLRELTGIVADVMGGGRRNDPRGTMTRLAELQAQIGESARVARQAIAVSEDESPLNRVGRRLGMG